jgi:hypothetical protein
MFRIEPWWGRYAIGPQLKPYVKSVTVLFMELKFGDGIGIGREGGGAQELNLLAQNRNGIKSLGQVQKGKTGGSGFPILNLMVGSPVDAIGYSRSH